MHKYYQTGKVSLVFADKRKVGIRKIAMIASGKVVAVLLLDRRAGDIVAPFSIALQA